MKKPLLSIGYFADIAMLFDLSFILLRVIEAGLNYLYQKAKQP